MTEVTSGKSPRARPVRRQARGQRRIEAILDAAAPLIAEVGFEETTTNAIAAKAGISPGSLYQFFANKGAILDALVERYRADLHAFWDEQLTADVTTSPLPELIDRFLDAMARFKAARPAFWVLFHGSATSELLAGAAKQLDDEIVDRLDVLFAARAPTLTRERRRLVAQVTVAAVKSLMHLVVEGPPSEAMAALAELKGVLVGYLSPVLDGDPPP